MAFVTKGLVLSFNLADFKNFAGIAASNTADDRLILRVLYPAAAQQIASILGSDDREAVKSVGNVQIQRGQAAGPITITPQHRFVLPGSGLRFRPTSDVNTIILADKAEQNIPITATQTGNQYDTESGEFFNQVIPALPESVKALNLGTSTGEFNFVLPDSRSVTLAIYYSCLFLFENRSFLKEKLRPAIMKNIIGILSKDRRIKVKKFIPDPTSENTNAE